MRTVIAILLLLFGGSAHADLQPDPPFGTAGVVDVVFGGGPLFWTPPELIVHADRRITLVAMLGYNEPRPPTLKLARLLPDGRPDTTFGAGGIVTTTLSTLPVTYGAVRQFLPLPDGRVLVFSYTMRIEDVPGSDPVYHPQLQLLRLRSDGSADPAFNGGQVWTSEDPRIQGGELLLDGEVVTVVAGESYCCNLPTGFHALRLRADGSTDTAFGSGGFLAVAPFDSGSVGAMSVPGGGFQILHYRWPLPDRPASNFWRRYRADGSLDTAFGSGGQQEIPRTGAFAMTRLLAVGDGTQIGAVGGCPMHAFDGEGRVLATFADCPVRVPPVNARVQPYGDQWLYSGEERFGGVPPPSDGTYLFVTDRLGRVDAGFAHPQGLRWRPPESPSASYSVAADGAAHVVLARAAPDGLRVLRYREMRGAEPAAQPVPALGTWGALLLALTLLQLGQRRLRRR